MADREIVRMQVSDQGPIGVASKWFAAILEREDMAVAWELVHPRDRRKVAEAWVKANANHPLVTMRDSEQLTDALAEAPSGDPLWPAFADTHLKELKKAWSHVDMETWGWGSDPRPYGPDQELAILFNTGGRFGVVVEEDTPLPGLPFVLELTTSGWKMTYERADEGALLEADPRSA